MTTKIQDLSQSFPNATEADWLDAVGKALKGKDLSKITRTTRDGLSIKPLYRESDFASAQNLRGLPGQAPYLRGPTGNPNQYLPWDIRQAFSHPDPKITNSDILRGLERGVTSIQLHADISGKTGTCLASLEDFETALSGVQANIAPIALSAGHPNHAAFAALLSAWGQKQDNPDKLKLAFNLSPLSELMQQGQLHTDIDEAFEAAAKLTQSFAQDFPMSTTLQAEAISVHEAGGTEAQELGALIAHAVDLLRRLDRCGLAAEEAAEGLIFALSVDANYGLGIAKLRAARRLWARVQEALQLPFSPMKLHAISSARMLTRYDPWVNILRGTSACFAAATGGADIITVRPFNDALGQPDELGHRIARNTQIIAMEESGLGRVADPSGGAWFSETLGEELAEAAWAEFQMIEAEGSLAESLIQGQLQKRVAEQSSALQKDIARRKVPVTGVSEFPLLNEVEASTAPIDFTGSSKEVEMSALEAMLGRVEYSEEPAIKIQSLEPIRLAEPFERLRDRAEAHFKKTGKRPSIFLATLGPIAEHTARADFARNLFAAGGIEAITTDSFEASGCSIAVICGSDTRYTEKAATTAKTLKTKGATHIWIAGKFESDAIDRHIFMGCDAVHECELALAELGVKA